MAKSSINFEKAKDHSSEHNLREDEPDYLLPKEHRLGNEYWNNSKSAKELFDAELQKAERKGGRVPKFENSHWEGALNLNREHTLEDVQKVAKHIEKEFNVICAQISIHRDEGHINERGVVEYNLHAHLNFVTYKDGKQNWRLSAIKNKMPQLQTDIANILRMERGKESNYTAEQKEQIKAKVGKFSDYADKKAYNEKFAEVAKELGFESRGKARQHLKPKEFKEQQKLMDNLKAEIAQLRAELKEAKAGRADYAQLEQFSKELKAQLEAKDLTIETLRKSVDYWRDGYKRESQEIKKLEKQLSEALQSKKAPETIKDTPKEEKNDFRASEGHYLRQNMILQKEIKQIKEENIKLKEENTKLSWYKEKYREFCQTLQRLTGYTAIEDAWKEVKGRFSSLTQAKREEKPKSIFEQLKEDVAQIHKENPDIKAEVEKKTYRGQDLKQEPEKPKSRGFSHDR